MSALSQYAARFGFEVVGADDALAVTGRVRAEVSDQERHPMNHQARDEMNITGQPVQLGDRDRATLPARFFKCGGELRLRQKLPRLEEALLG